MLSGVFAERMREIRARRQWSQDRLSDALGELGHGISRSDLSKLETGQKRVTLDDAIAIALALEVPFADLLIPRDLDREVITLPPPEPPMTGRTLRTWLPGLRGRPSPNLMNLEGEQIAISFERSRERGEWWRVQSVTESPWRDITPELAAAFRELLSVVDLERKELAVTEDGGGFGRPGAEAITFVRNTSLQVRRRALAKLIAALNALLEDLKEMDDGEH